MLQQKPAKERQQVAGRRKSRMCDPRNRGNQSKNGESQSFPLRQPAPVRVAVASAIALPLDVFRVSSPFDRDLGGRVFDVAQIAGRELDRRRRYVFL